MPTDKIKDVYDLISDKGYFTDENEFRSYVNDPKKIKEVYSLIQDDGFFKDEKEFESYFSDVKKKETFGLGYKKPSEAMRMGGLPKQEKLSQSPLKTAATTTPSVSTKPKWTAEQQKALIEGIKTGNLTGNTPQESDYLNRIGDRIIRGMNTLNYNLAKTPEFVYNLAAMPQNIIAEQFDVPSLAVSAEKVKKDLGIENNVAEYYKEQINQLAALDDKYMGANGSVTELAKQGKYIDAAKLLGEQIAESLPTTAAIAVTGGLGASPTAITLGGGTVFGAAKYDEIADREDLTESEKASISFATGLTEGLFENLGTGNIGRIVKDAISKQGVEQGKQVAKEMFVTAYKDALKKYMPVSGALQEGIEEAATQFSQNAIDIYTGVDPQKKLTDGLIDAFAVGTGSGLVISSPALLSKKRNKQVEEKQAEVDEIDSELSNPNISDDAKATLTQKRIKVMSEINDVIDEDVLEQKSLPESVKREIEQLQGGLEQIDADIENTKSELAKKELQNKRTELENKIEELVTTTEKQTTDEQGRIKEPINRGTDVLEEGIGVAVEPNKEGIAGEDIQTETVPQAPLEEQKSDIERRRQEELDNQAGNIRVKTEVVEGINDNDEPTRILIHTNKDGSRTVQFEGKFNGEKDWTRIGTEKVSADTPLEARGYANRTYGIKKPRVVEIIENPQSLPADKINAKYDAEIAALENQKSPEVVSERVSEIEPPVVEQTTADVGGVTTPDVSEDFIDNNDGTAIYNGVKVKYIVNKDGTRLYSTILPDNIIELSKEDQKRLLLASKELNDIERIKRSQIQQAKSQEKGVTFRFSDFPKSKWGEGATARNYINAVEKIINSGEKIDDKTREDYERYKKIFGSQTIVEGEPTPPTKEEVAPQEEPTPPKEEGEGDFEARQEKAKEETAEVRKENNNISYRQAVNLVNKYVREVKPNETITPQEIQQAFQNKEQGKTREGWTQPSKEGGDKERAISKKFEFNGVELPASIKYYAPITFEEARVKAKEVLDKLGLEKTIELITKMPDWLDSRFIPAIGNAVVLEIQRLQDIAASKNDMVELDRLADLNLDVHNLIAPLTTHNAQYLSMMRVFYEGHEYNQLKEVTKALEKLNSGKIAEFKTLLGELDLINKRIIDQAATNVSKRVATTKVASAKKNYEKSKQHLKDVFRKSSNLGIGETPYNRARKNLEFDRALIRLAKDFVVYQSVKFSEFIKEISASIGISEEDIDKTHLKGIFDKVKESEIRRGVKGALSDMDLQLKDLIVNHYSELESTELQLVEKLSESFGLSEGDAQEVANLIKDEVRKISYEQKVKAVKNSALKNLGWADELIALSDSGAINNEEVFKKFLDKIGIKQLTDEQSKKLLELAKDAKNEKDPQKQAAKWQDVQDYKSVLTRKYGISDFTVSWYLTNIFGSIGANEINVASNTFEQIVLLAGEVFDSLAKGKISDIAILMKKYSEGLERGARFTKEVMKTGKATYRGAESIKPRNMWELIMMRDKDDLSNIEAFLQYVFKTPVAGKIFLAERRFWNRALSSMDAFSGVTNIEIGAFYSAKREADKLGLSGKKRADYIRERLGDTEELTKEAEQKATELGYKKGSKKFKQFVVDYKISKRPEEIIEKSRKYSGFATLTQEPPINSFVGAVARAINNQATKSPSIKYVFPVVNTLANLIIKNIERTPFEAISLTMDVIRSRREEASPALKEYVSKEEIDRRLKTAIFWTIFGTAIFVLAGGFDDDDEGFEIYGSGSGDPVLDAERRALGWKPYTIKFSEGGGYYNYEYTPAGLLLAMIGDLRDYMKNADNTLLNLRKKISKDMFGVELDALTKEQRAALEVELFSGKYNAGEKANKKMTEMIFKMGFTPIQYSLSILKSLGDIIGLGESKSPEEKGKKFVSNILRGIVSPRYMGEVKEVFDEKYYDSKKFWNNVVANTPFITFSDGVKLDAFGREVTKYDREQGFAGIKDGLKYLATRRFYNPSRGTDVDKFLFENSIKVSPPQNTVDLSYTEDDYKKYIVRRGQIALEMIGDRIKDSEFMKLTPLQKKEVIDRDLQRANEISKYEINQLIGRIK